MKRSSRWASGLSLAMVVATGESNADSIRCGDQLASTGASPYEVRMSCGEPDASTRRIEHRTVIQRLPGPCVTQYGRTVCGSSVATVVEVVVDEWTYDFGNNRFIHFVSFEDGRLTTVRRGGYGKKPAA